MGIVIEQRCPKCGYIKTFQEGVGMGAINLQLIKMIFSCDELAAFLQKLEEGKVENYLFRKRHQYARDVLCHWNEKKLDIGIKDSVPIIQAALWQVIF